ncbi:MAG: hypothetical protein LUG99_00525 [Lachnospiraceae bacterium]|nr:hypothetical protein [Lachnospiraceae bacterium]
MAYNTASHVSVQNLKDALTRVKTEYLAAISKTGHATFQKADAVPDASEAEENVLYLVKNTETGYYDIYALIDGSLEWLDDAGVDLDGYVTTQDLEDAISAISVATDAEIEEVLDEVFGSSDDSSTDDESDTGTDETAE